MYPWLQIELSQSETLIGVIIHYMYKTQDTRRERMSIADDEIEVRGGPDYLKDRTINKPIEINQKCNTLGEESRPGH